MSLTLSNMLELSTQAPDFTLPDVASGQDLSLRDVRGKEGTVVMFICNHCPFVIHVNRELVNLANDYMAQEIGFVAISSNDVENYPQDGPDRMKEHAEKESYPFAYLYDESQEVAKSYDAACTPDIYVFDSQDKLYYRGQIDGSRPGNDLPVTGVDLRSALDNMIKGEAPPEKQYPGAGCNIKWKQPTEGHLY